MAFQICVPPDDRETICVIPRCSGGKKWEKLRSGLPKKVSFITVLRERSRR
ncbi:hypothetical protein [Mariniblastus fucicola]|uniref:hypothetical protein n=1 Tax=Mariniblastus fucicola TaxID=980251 RepID=UPI0012F89FF3|nr:hypothetical protein [Mariniblastus fucicola]